MHHITQATTATTMLLVVLVMMGQWQRAKGLENLLLNPSFEESLQGTWNTKGFTGEQYDGDALDGQYSLLCTDRTRELAGPAQYIYGLRMGRGYELRAYVKLLNDNPEKLWQQLKAVIKFDFTVKVDGNTIQPVSEKPKRCVGLKGEERKECLAVLRKWREQLKKERAEKKKLRQDRKKEQQRKKQEQKKKQKDKKKKKKKKTKDMKKKDKQKEKSKNKKKKQKDKDKKEKDKEKKKDKQAKEKAKEQKEEDRQKSKEQKDKERQRKKDKKERERQKNKERKEKDRQRAKDKKGKTNREQTSAGSARSTKAGSLAQLILPLEPQMTQRKRRDVYHSVTRRRRLLRQRHRRQAPLPEEQEEHERNLRIAASGLPASGIETATGAYIIAWRAFATSKQGWILLTGNINAPMLPFSGAELALRGPDEGIDFLVDNMTLYEIPERSDWLAASHDMIDKNRKSNINFRVSVPSGVNPADIDVQVQLKSHLFAFGSKVEDKLMYRKNSEQFRDLFFNLFNWATIGSFKWRFDKSRDLYSPNFNNAMKALDVLNENGIKVRAHSIFWGVKKNIPDSVVATPPEELPRLIKFRTEYMVNLTKGRVEHWDVQNEFLHGHWYEETLKDPNVTQNIFKLARPLDTKVKLYLNDFTAINSGANTEDYHDLGVRFIKAGTGIQGLGVQGHVKDYIRPTPTMIWRRLDRLAETGLEIFLTEFDIGWRDDVVRADWFEDAMRAYFAHPGLNGVILWGFWKDWQTYKDKYLVFGEDMQFAEPGQRYVCLTQKEWTTRETFNMRNPVPPTIRGFQGDYEVIIKKQGVPVQRETFTLGKEEKVVDIRITESTAPIAVQEKIDHVPQCISHRDQKSLGAVNSSLLSQQPTSFICSDRKSSASGPSEGAEVSVTCEAGEIMTSCSSFHEGHASSARRGERITVKGGVVTCKAIKGPGSNQGVRASARCCRAPDLKCDYWHAGPSSPMDGAMAEASCPQGRASLGCSIYNQHSVLDGAFPNKEMTSCLAQSGPPSSDDPTRKTGAESYAACCHTPGLQCRQVASSEEPIRGGTVKVTCPAGDVMTGCNVMGENGGSAGAHIETDPNSGTAYCKALIGSDLPEGVTSVTAVAVCCNSSSS